MPLTSASTHGTKIYSILEAERERHLSRDMADREETFTLIHLPHPIVSNICILALHSSQVQPSQVTGPRIPDSSESGVPSISFFYIFLKETLES